LDPIGQLGPTDGMVVGFEAVNAAPAGIVEMNADKNGIFLRILDCDAAIEWNENVA